jgi:hypothetical protein
MAVIKKKQVEKAKTVQTKKKVATKAPAKKAPAKKASASAKKANPTSFKDQILAILQMANKPIGLPTLKKEMFAQFDRENTASCRNNINKALSALEAEDRQDFGKIGTCSYHAGPSTAAGRKAIAVDLKDSAMDKRANNKANKKADARAAKMAGLKKLTGFPKGKLETLHLRFMNGTCLAVNGLWRGCTALDVKLKVQDTKGIPPDNLVLLSMGPLFDGHAGGVIESDEEVPAKNNAVLFCKLQL